jgi:hypothetical protein
MIRKPKASDDQAFVYVMSAAITRVLDEYGYEFNKVIPSNDSPGC